LILRIDFSCFMTTLCKQYIQWRGEDLIGMFLPKRTIRFTYFTWTYFEPNFYELLQILVVILGFHIAANFHSRPILFSNFLIKKLTVMKSFIRLNFYPIYTKVKLKKPLFYMIITNYELKVVMNFNADYIGICELKVVTI